MSHWIQAGWRRFCQVMTTIFYRNPEFSGLENLPTSGPVVLCGNHVNALVDAVVIQAGCPRPIHPLARGGLFRNPILRPVLGLIQAIPVYRRRPGTEQTGTSNASLSNASVSNEDAFRRCYEVLEQGEVILIFPEGQSHSDPSLRPLKTGAARLALGLHERVGELPPVIPVGLTFPQKGRFRSEMLVQFGEPVVLELEIEGTDESPKEQVRRLTQTIGEGLEQVTLNTDSWEDLELMRLLQHFFLLRGGRHDDQPEKPLGRELPLSERFRALHRMIEAHRWLRLTHPIEIRLLREKLKRFEEVCERYGVHDYHLSLRYRPASVALFLARSLAFLIFVFPLALWGVLNSALPYLVTRTLTRLSARGRDQYDTAGMLYGLVFFFAFWSAQTYAVFRIWGQTQSTIFYAVSLPLTAGLALVISLERKRILENVRVFLLFLRRSGLQDYLLLRRQELEVEVTRLTRIARQAN